MPALNVFLTSATLLSFAIYTFAVIVVASLPVMVIRRKIRKMKSLRSPLSCRSTTIEELPALHKYCLSIFGDQISDLSAMQSWFERNNNIFEILTRAEAGKAQSDDIEGYFSVLPLTDEAKKAIAKGIYSGATLPTEAITSADRASLIYVGGVAANSPDNSRKIMHSLMARIDAFDSANVIYTRPVTQDGLRWVLKSHFTRLDGSPNTLLNYIYKKDIDNVLPKRKGARIKAALRTQSRKTRFFETSYGVFQGGGCRAAAYVGAYAEAVARGVRFVEVAGTSAGAIIAVLIAAGATPLQLREIVNRLDFSQLLSPPNPMRKAVNILLWSILRVVSLIPHRIPRFLGLIVLRNGLHSSQKLRAWLETELKSLLPNVPRGDEVRFQHLHLPASVVAADLRERKVKVWSSHTSSASGVADAVCSSCSIPFVFQPYENRYVDGGTLSNLPSFVFNHKDRPRRANQPILAFTLNADVEQDELLRPLGLVFAVVNTMIDGSQELQQKMMENVHAISLPTGKVKATDFLEMTVDKVSKLVKSGQMTTRAYLDNELDKIHLRTPPRLECDNQEEVLATLTERLLQSRKTALFSFDELDWLDDLGYALLRARMNAVRIHVFYNDAVNSAAENQRRVRLLRAAGCTVSAAAAISVRGSLFDSDDLQNSFAFLQSDPRQFGSGVLYSGRNDMAAISCITKSFPQLTSETLPRLSLQRCKSNEIGFLSRRLKSVSQYASDGVDAKLEEVPLSKLICLSKHVQEHRYKQATSLVEIYQKDGIRMYEPVCLSTDALNRTFLMAPVVEKDASSGNYYILDGVSRALASHHAELPSIFCLVVSGVRDSLPSSGRYALEHVQIVCKPVQVADRYEDFDQQHFRWLPGCVVCSG